MVFNATFSYIMEVSFIGGGNQSNRRKPLTCHKSLTKSQSTPLNERDSNSKL
jgi:hypothetical protein